MQNPVPAREPFLPIFAVILAAKMQPLRFHPRYEDRYFQQEDIHPVLLFVMLPQSKSALISIHRHLVSIAYCYDLARFDKLLAG